MKVIAKQTHYSVIFMRDDAEVTVFRMKNTTLKVLIWIFVFFVLLGLGGITAGVLVGRSYYKLSQKYQEMDRQVVESKLKLERLSSLQALLQVSGNSTMPASRARNDEIMAVSGNSAEATAASPTDRDADVAVAPQAKADAGDAADQADAAQAVSSQNATTAEAAPPTEDLPLISSDDSPVRIANMSIRPSGQLRIRVRYDITSPQELRQQLTGRVHYAVVLEDGKRVEVRAADYGETRFAILRLKQMENFLQLPAGANINSSMVKAVEITVQVADGARYRELFTLGEEGN